MYYTQLIFVHISVETASNKNKWSKLKNICVILLTKIPSPKDLLNMSVNPHLPKYLIPEPGHWHC